jgi:hypothetical protein
MPSQGSIYKPIQASKGLGVKVGFWGASKPIQASISKAT